MNIHANDQKRTISMNSIARCDNSDNGASTSKRKRFYSDTHVTFSISSVTSEQQFPPEDTNAVPSTDDRRQVQRQHALNGILGSFPNAFNGASQSCSSSSSSCQPAGENCVRFALRKRVPNPLLSYDNDRGEKESLSSSPSSIRAHSKLPSQTAFMSSYNSDFLQGLFSDVAQANNNDNNCQEDSNIMKNNADGHTTDDLRSSDDNASIKKSRLTLNRSMSRHTKSYKNLSNLFSPRDEIVTSNKKRTVTMDSCCSSFSIAKPTINKATGGVCDKFPFPILPATVSDQEITSSKLKNTNQEEMIDNSDERSCYGWFVKVDLDDNADHVPNPYNDSSHNISSSSCSELTGAKGLVQDNLAFTAPTAPIQCSNHDAEVEWAKAADTVDEVLGNFF